MARKILGSRMTVAVSVTEYLPDIFGWRAMRLAFLTFFVAFSFAAIVTVAFAGHYHNFNGVNHGFVHGGSETDGAMHSRVDSNLNPGQKYCGVYYETTFIGSSSVPFGNTSTCNYFSSIGSTLECRFSALVYQSGVFGYHYHYAHGYTGTC